MARKEFSVFNLSFLDVMSCGFGAVILVFVLINAQVKNDVENKNAEALSETRLIEDEVLEGRKDLVRLRAELDEVLLLKSASAGERQQLEKTLASLREDIQSQKPGLASTESLARLKTDVASLRVARDKLSAQVDKGTQSGRQVRSFAGDGDRQYLTGLRMGGKHILILVDGSASMLGNTYVNVVRFRGLPEKKRVRAPKWRSVTRAVDWLTARMPADASFQLMVFNDKTQSLVDGSANAWVPVGDGQRLSAAVQALRSFAPAGGASLYRALAELKQLRPMPDNVYLLTDSLPVQGKDVPGKAGMVSPEKRVNYFNQALAQLPGNVPVNVLLYPMDGDPMAAGNFWRLAVESNGSFMTPSSDWP